jgi:hypothetical protein
MQLYYDGSLVASQAWSGAFASSAPLRFGGAPGRVTFTGELDEIALYNKVLSPAAIRAHYEAGIESLPGPDLSIKQFAVYADRSIRTGLGDGVHGGSVGVASMVTGTGAQLVVGQKNRLDPVRPVFAPSISLSSGDSVGDAYTNSIVNNGGFVGEQNAYPTGMPRVPVSPVPSPGTVDLTVPKGQSMTLTEGARYRNITVLGALTLRTGKYECASLVIGANAQLFADSNTLVEVQVAGPIVMAGGNAVRTTGAPAGAFRISSAASDANGSPAVSIGKAVSLRALLTASNGSVTISNSTRWVGALAASSITLADAIQISYESGFPQNGSASPD